jgi:hypothetical protein
MKTPSRYSMIYDRRAAPGQPRWRVPAPGEELPESLREETALRRERMQREWLRQARLAMAHKRQARRVALAAAYKLEQQARRAARHAEIMAEKARSVI